MMAGKLASIGIDRERDLLGAALHARAERARRLEAEMARRRRKNTKPTMSAPASSADVERVGRRQAADFDQKGA